jgi:PEP-CTERM motif
MRLIARSLVVLTVFFAASTLAARADSFSYSFTDTTDSVVDYNYFTYISPTLITTTTTFLPLTCRINGVACSYVMFTFDPTSTVGPAELTLQAPKTGDGYFFNSVDFLTTPGTNTAFNGHLTLTITDLSTTSSVPEPSTIALLGTGILGLAGAARRKFLQA